MIRNQLSACIICGSDTESRLASCIEQSMSLVDEVVCLDLGADEGTMARASELGAVITKPEGLSSTLSSEWILLLIPGERPVLSSEKELEVLLSNRHVQGYLVYTSKNARGTLEDYQLIRNLGQYARMGAQAYVKIAEPRLFRKRWAARCVEAVTSRGSEEVRVIFDEIIKCLTIELTHEETLDEDKKDRTRHEKQCLRGEVYYGPLPGEGLNELSFGFIGFRVVHDGYVDVLKNVAGLGFGTELMYLPMIEFLKENRKFVHAKELLETWTKNNKEHGSLRLQGCAAEIYTNLFMLDEAIRYYKKIAEATEDPMTYGRIGELLLVDGKKLEAVEYFKKATSIRNDKFYEGILSSITKSTWRTPILSVCMIAKNEEDTIQRALESTRNIADEIVVVDTGSSDNTRELAIRCGARVVDLEWRDDFSAARNRAIQEATGDYILMLDADEFIDASDQIDIALLKQVLPQDKGMAFEVTIETDRDSEGMSVSLMRNVLQQEAVGDRQVRLFPRIDGAWYEGEAFETVDRTLREKGVRIMRTELVRITHNRGDARDRDLRKVRAVARSFDHIGDTAKFVKGGLFFLRTGDLDTANAWFERMETSDPDLLSKLAAFYVKQGRPDCAEALIRKGMRDFPELPQLLFVLAQVHYASGDYGGIRNVLAGKIDRIMKDLDQESRAQIAYYYGMACLDAGSLAEGVEHIAFASEKNPLDMKYKTAGMLALAKSDEWEEALEIAGQIVADENVPIDFEIGDFGDVGVLFVELARHFRKEHKNDEAETCHRIVRHVIGEKISNEKEVERLTQVLRGVTQRSRSRGAPELCET